MSHEQRLAKCERLLVARTGPDGNALPNFAENVTAIRAEIARIKARIQAS